jgi:hypothetical protein
MIKISILGVPVLLVLVCFTLYYYFVSPAGSKPSLGVITSFLQWVGLVTPLVHKQVNDPERTTLEPGKDPISLDKYTNYQNPQLCKIGLLIKTSLKATIRCAITGKLVEDAMIVKFSSKTYGNEVIIKWFERCRGNYKPCTDPITHKCETSSSQYKSNLPHERLTPNLAIRSIVKLLEESPDNEFVDVVKLKNLLRCPGTGELIVNPYIDITTGESISQSALPHSNLSNYIENCMLKGVLELAGPALAASALVPMQVSADIAAI